MINRGLRAVSGLWGTIVRFPIPVLFAIFFCFVALEANPSGHWIEYLPVLLVLFLYFSVAKLAAESANWPAILHYPVSILVGAGIGWFVYVSPVYYETAFMLSAAFFILIFAAPYLFAKDQDSERIWKFKFDIWVRIIWAFFLALALFLAVALILSSLKFLFGIKVPDRHFIDVWIFCATLFAPIFTLAGTPRDFSARSENFPAIFRFALLYLILPLISIYALILLGYVGKLFYVNVLPKGELAVIVILFSIAGVCAYVLSYPILKENGIVRRFFQIFFPFLILPLALLILAVYVRVEQYGVTPDRYILAIVAVWIGVLVLIALLSKGRPGLKHLLMVLPVLSVFGVGSPWGMHELTAKSQLKLLEAQLIEREFLVDGEIQPQRGVDELFQKTKDQLPKDKYVRSVSSKLQHLVWYQTSDPRYAWFTEFMADIHADLRLDPTRKPRANTTTGYKYRNQMRNAVYKHLNIPGTQHEPDGMKWFTYSFWTTNIRAVKVSGYDYALRVQDSIDRFEAGKVMLIEHEGEKREFTLQLGQDHNHLEITDVAGEVALKLDLTRILQEAASDSSAKAPNEKALLSVAGEKDGLKAQFILDSINGYASDNLEKMKLRHLSFRLLITSPSLSDGRSSLAREEEVLARPKEAEQQDEEE